MRLLGPAPAPVAKIKNLFRFHLRLQAPTVKPLQQLVHQVVMNHDVPGNIEIAIDVDALSLS